jgi:hypothetical protein
VRRDRFTAELAHLLQCRSKIRNSENSVTRVALHVSFEDLGKHWSDWFCEGDRLTLPNSQLSASEVNVIPTEAQKLVNA